MSKHEFQTEVTQLLDLMIHSLYSNKEIFLRELISNASDALDKLNYLCISDDKFKDLIYEPKIEITVDKELKTLTLSDSGIGMSKDDLVKNLGTIAKSGTKSFVEKLSGDAKKDSSLIGQFGVGFYSAFMVASKVEVQSKKAGAKSANTWVSEGGGEYEIKDSKKESHGTTITLFLKDDEVEFLESYRIESIIQKYSNHIPFPIFLQKSEKKEDEKTEITNEQINKASALWRMNKSEIKEQEYFDFYKSISHDSEDPILYSHTKAEGTIEYSTLFYIPKTAPFDLFRVDYQSGIKLYVKRVFITDDDKELLPTYLRFVRGIIDVEDLPLNVSREILQENIILSKVKKASVKKILGELKKLKNKDFDKYKEFYSVFGKVLKEGIMSEYENRDLLLELLLFKSSKRDDLINLEQYKEEMSEEQKEMYYIVGDNASALKNSPLIEGFNEKGIEVLILDDEVDTIVIPNISQYKEIPLTAANHADFGENNEASKELSEKFAQILVKMKEELKDEVKDVKISPRLKKSPTCLVYDKNDPDFAMQQMMKQMGQGGDFPPIKPILEINANHEIFTKILEKNDFVSLTNLSHVLLDLAKLSEGMKIENSVDFADRVNKLIASTL